MTERRSPHLALAALALALAACGAPSTPAGGTGAALEEAVERAGDVSVRASVVPTAMLNDAVAREYGIQPDRRSVMLLVGVRQGAERQETALPARITASSTDLRGVRSRIEMREVRSGDLVDYVGTVRVVPPETLRFELEVEHAAGAPSRMSFSRDIFPR